MSGPCTRAPRNTFRARLPRRVRWTDDRRNLLSVTEVDLFGRVLLLDKIAPRMSAIMSAIDDGADTAEAIARATNIPVGVVKIDLPRLFPVCAPTGDGRWVRSWRPGQPGIEA